jgi:hypothetical protein
MRKSRLVLRHGSIYQEPGAVPARQRVQRLLNVTSERANEAVDGFGWSMRSGIYQTEQHAPVMEPGCGHDRLGDIWTQG